MITLNDVTSFKLRQVAYPYRRKEARHIGSHIFISQHRKKRFALRKDAGRRAVRLINTPRTRTVTHVQGEKKKAPSLLCALLFFPPSPPSFYRSLSRSEARRFISISVSVWISVSVSVSVSISISSFLGSPIFSSCYLLHFLRLFFFLTPYLVREALRRPGVVSILPALLLFLLFLLRSRFIVVFFIFFHPRPLLLYSLLFFSLFTTSPSPFAPLLPSSRASFRRRPFAIEALAYCTNTFLHSRFSLTSTSGFPSLLPSGSVSPVEEKLCFILYYFYFLAMSFFPFLHFIPFFHSFLPTSEAPKLEPTQEQLRNIGTQEYRNTRYRTEGEPIQEEVEPPKPTQVHRYSDEPQGWKKYSPIFLFFLQIPSTLYFLLF